MGEPLRVVCLCAAWCRLCDDYAPVLDEVVRALAAEGLPVQPHWLDIEDEADLLGDLDVETFPTIVVARGSALRFAGPLTPQPQTLARLLRTLVRDEAAGTTAAAGMPEARAFVQRLHQRLTGA